MKMIYDIAIIGGGPAGMIAGIIAGTKARAVILEKNRKLGKKLVITGKGRCNITTSKSKIAIIKAFGPNGRFLYGPLSRFSNEETMNFFKNIGVSLDIERGARVFPKSDKAETVRDTLVKVLQDSKTDIQTNFEVGKINLNKGIFKISSTQNNDILAKKLIIATGGKSYPQTGSTGDGYRFAQELGHTIITPRPALVPLIVESHEIRALAGLSLKNVQIKFFTNSSSKPFAESFGEMLFTHTGISGPIVLDSSKQIGKEIEKTKGQTKITASIDLKPALSDQVLTARINREISETPKVEFHTLLQRLLPKSLIKTAILRTKIVRSLRIGNLKKTQKQDLISFLKDFRFEIDNVAPIEQGIITAGGVDLKEIDSRTMESKIVKGLYFAGEIINLDGPTGGFNLQVAWTTGYVAGTSASP